MQLFSRIFMFVCFTSAAILFSAWRLPPMSKNSSQAYLKASLPISKLKNKSANSTRLIVNLSDRRVYVYSANKLLAKYPVAVGKQGWQTPTGNFKIRNKYRNPAWVEPITGEVIRARQNNPLGDRWIGFWSDGKHQIGFHGTNREELVGEAVSHGCLRMKNRDVRALYEQVSKGTQVIVQK